MSLSAPTYEKKKRTEIKKNHRAYDLVVTWLVSTDGLEFWVYRLERSQSDCYGAGESGRGWRGIFDECGCHAVTTRRGWKVDFGTSLSGPYLQPALDDIVPFLLFDLFSPAFDFLLASRPCFISPSVKFFPGVPYISSKVLPRRFVGLGNERVPVLLA